MVDVLEELARAAVEGKHACVINIGTCEHPDRKVSGSPPVFFHGVEIKFDCKCPNKDVVVIYPPDVTDEEFDRMIRQLIDMRAQER